MAGVILAVSGKGGVGKTSISAAIVRLLVEHHPKARILAIDADPATGLATALGVDVVQTLDNIRVRIAESAEKGETREAVELLGEARFQILDALAEQGGGGSFAFLAIGRPETAGCYCAINSYLKEVLTLLAAEFDYVVIDGEAGVEQINRRVMERVTHLLLISDQSRKGIQVLQTILEVARRMVMYDRCGVVINRITSPNLEIRLDGIDLLACIPSDNIHAENDILGKSVFDLSPESPVLTGAETALRNFTLI
ncbi:MAG: AAA family ATPase [Spirochaetaceae bacterium]|jgi:CO dehydrogenase maturation factor|nr:AAA family ATPase [Spirochaetaceae bacterium]